MLKLDGYGWQWKVPITLAFSKLVLNVKVKFLLISWHFLVVFWLRHPHPPIHWNPRFCYIKGIQLVHIWAKFHLCLICSSPILKFQIFSCSRRYNFRLLLCGFFGPNPLKYSQICLKFWPEMQCNIMHQACDGFYFILKKHLKLSQEIDFLAHFERFLVYAFIRPMSYNPIFCQI